MTDTPVKDAAVIDKATFCHYWQRQGNWPEVEAFKNQAIREARASGLHTDEARNAGWAKVVERFPLPAPPPDPVPSLDAPQVPDADLLIPESWADLPKAVTAADIKAELLWAHANERNIEQRPGKTSLIYWGRCSDPPTCSAQSVLEFADTNHAKFMEQIFRLTVDEDPDKDDAELVREEKKSIAEVQRLLEKFAEV